MYGAIIGDMIGVPYEFLHDEILLDFELFTDYTRFSDDSIMTVAIADAMLRIKQKKLKEDDACKVITERMQYFGRQYPGVGYGTSFGDWLLKDEPKPYNSWGNGSAMRVSSVGWLFDTLEETEEKAEWSAKVTHNHPEGIKGAQSVAAAIFLARNGYSNEEIKKYISTKYGYDLNRTCKEIIKNGYKFEVSCQKSVPEAIICFLEGTDYESTIRNAIFLDGDSDTQAAIAGSIAEAFYGIPDSFKEEARKRLKPDLLEVIDKFYDYKSFL